MSTENTTPVERARARLARAVADDLYAGSTTGDVYDVTVRHEGETFRDLAERVGSIAADSLDEALAGSLDRDEIARVLSRATWPDGGHDGFPSRKVAEMLADALIAHLTATEAQR